MIFFKKWKVGEAPSTIFLKKTIRTQICVYEDLKLNGWVTHQLPKSSELGVPLK
jgi:hypothetical protein